MPDHSPTERPVDEAGRAAAQTQEETEAQRSEREAEELLERDLDELGETKRERDEYLELAQRTRADFDNYRKRVAKEASEALARGKAELARELLPAIDNLERALDVLPRRWGCPGQRGRAGARRDAVDAPGRRRRGLRPDR